MAFAYVSSKCSHATASPSHHDTAIPVLSPVLFMPVGEPSIWGTSKNDKNQWWKVIVAIWCVNGGGEEEEKQSEDRKYACMHTQDVTSMYETKKGGETSKLRRGKANMHRKEDSNCWDMQPRWYSDNAPLGRYISTCPMLPQRSPAQ